MGDERKAEIKNDSKVLSLNNYKDGVAIDREDQSCQRSRFRGEEWWSSFGQVKSEAEMSSRQLHILVRSSEVRSGLEIYRWYLNLKDRMRLLRKWNQTDKRRGWALGHSNTERLGRRAQIRRLKRCVRWDRRKIKRMWGPGSLVKKSL